jgi:O-antigen/teichoic acid export membrane protein
MEWAALIAWVITAAFGFTMLVIWLKNGGMQQRGGGGKIPPWLILSHFLLAASGLVVWVIYLAADKDVLAWIAFAALAVVAGLGWTMFFGWARQRSQVQAPTATPAPVEPGAELRFPIPVIAVHGLAAVTTVVLVFLTAIGVGGS